MTGEQLREDTCLRQKKGPVPEDWTFLDFPELAGLIALIAWSCGKMRVCDNGYYPETQVVVEYVVSWQVRRLTKGDVLDGSDVIPGFTMPLARLFRQGS